MLKTAAIVMFGLCLFILNLVSRGSDVVPPDAAGNLVLGLGLSGLGTIILDAFLGGTGGSRQARARYNSQTQRSIPSRLQSTSRLPQQRPLPQRPMNQRSNHNNEPF